MTFTSTAPCSAIQHTWTRVLPSLLAQIPCRAQNIGGIEVKGLSLPPTSQRGKIINSCIQWDYFYLTTSSLWCSQQTQSWWPYVLFTFCTGEQERGPARRAKGPWLLLQRFFPLSCSAKARDGWTVRLGFPKPCWDPQPWDSLGKAMKTEKGFLFISLLLLECWRALSTWPRGIYLAALFGYLNKTLPLRAWPFPYTLTSPYGSSLILHNKTEREVPLYRHGNWSTERWNNLPRVTRSLEEDGVSTQHLAGVWILNQWGILVHLLLPLFCPHPCC